MILTFYELTAEMAYPVGESLSLGLFLGIYFGGRWLFLVSKNCLIDPKLDGTPKFMREKELYWFFICILIAFILVSLVCILMLWISDPELVRFKFDSLDIPEIEEDDEENEEEEKELELEEV